jgi:hypothetical protein
MTMEITGKPEIRMRTGTVTDSPERKYNELVRRGASSRDYSSQHTSMDANAVAFSSYINAALLAQKHGFNAELVSDAAISGFYAVMKGANVAMANGLPAIAKTYLEYAIITSERFGLGEDRTRMAVSKMRKLKALISSLPIRRLDLCANEQ